MSEVLDRVRSLIGDDPTGADGADASDVGEGADPELELGIDEALDVLSNSRRRLVIRFIQVHGDAEFDLNEVVRYIATEEYGLNFESMERKRVYISMYQTHMDQLVEAGVIEPVTDGEAHRYRPGVAADPLFSLLTTTEEVLEVSD